MSKMNVLMMGVLAAATVVADDGKDYRICGLDDGGRLMLVESRSSSTAHGRGIRSSPKARSA